MQIDAAHIDQIRRARNGRMVAISADAGGVAEELRRIDPHLKVRFAENGNPPFWAVFWESDDQRQTYLVTTMQARQASTGVWTGLDARIVERLQAIDSQNRSGYDYAKALARVDASVREAARHRFRERVGETAELAAHAIRKDLGVSYKGRAFIPKDPPTAA